MIAFSDSSRRGFLQTSALATGALFAGGLAAGLPMAAGASLRATQPAPGKKLRILILGGTGFIGPWMAEFAVARGHHVTLFNRGQREKYLGTTDGTKTLYGNRDPNLYSQTKVVEGKEVDDDTSPKGLSELAGKKWDAVIDNSGFVPRIVKASAELLAPNVGQYLFISTLSVYADNSKPGLDESDTLSTIDDPTNEEVGKNYGALKALCEQAAETAMPGRVTNIRPGYIVGPRDATDRLTYWPVRASRGGEVLVPGNPADAVQFIDVRDLADFTIRCVENKILGTFNATGPERKLPVSEFLAACLAASKATGNKGDATFTHIPYDWLAANDRPPGALPILLPGEGDYAGFHGRSVAKAVAAGMKYRSAEETCKAILTWWPEALKLRGKVAKEVEADRKAKGLPTPPQPPADRLRAGIPAEKEAELLAKWNAEQTQKKAG